MLLYLRTHFTYTYRSRVNGNNILAEVVFWKAQKIATVSKKKNLNTYFKNVNNNGMLGTVARAPDSCAVVAGRRVPHWLSFLRRTWAPGLPMPVALTSMNHKKYRKGISLKTKAVFCVCNDFRLELCIPHTTQR